MDRYVDRAGKLKQLLDQLGGQIHEMMELDILTVQLTEKGGK